MYIYQRSGEKKKHPTSTNAAKWSKEAKDRCLPSSGNCLHHLLEETGPAGQKRGGQAKQNHGLRWCLAASREQRPQSKTTSCLFRVEFAPLGKKTHLNFPQTSQSSPCFYHWGVGSSLSLSLDGSVKWGDKPSKSNLIILSKCAVFSVQESAFISTDGWFISSPKNEMNER